LVCGVGNCGGHSHLVGCDEPMTRRAEFIMLRLRGCVAEVWLELGQLPPMGG
jgi:hypothetical protein